MKSTFDELFKTDKETTRLSVGFNAKDEEVFLVVAEAGSPSHKKAQRKYTKALEASRRNEKKQNRIMARICAESILVDWENVLDEKGKPIEATVENKIDMLTQYERLMLAVIDTATEFSNFKNDPEAEAETEKN